MCVKRAELGLASNKMSVLRDRQPFIYEKRRRVGAYRHDRPGPHLDYTQSRTAISAAVGTALLTATLQHNSSSQRHRHLTSFSTELELSSSFQSSNFKFSVTIPSELPPTSQLSRMGKNIRLVFFNSEAVPIQNLRNRENYYVLQNFTATVQHSITVK